jgi:hypothetical protein
VQFDRLRAGLFRAGLFRWARSRAKKGGLLKPIGNIVLAAAIACASQAAIAQTKPVRVCTTELNLYPIGANAPEQVTRPPYIQPPSLPPDFPREAKGASTVIVTVPVAWTEKGFEARLRQEECDFVVLTWWEFRDLDANPTLPHSMPNDDIDRAWSMPMQAAPVNGPIPASAAKWLRHFELDRPDFQRVLATRGYPYSAAPEKKLLDIAKQMGMEILRVIDSRPRIENLPIAARPAKLLPLDAAPVTPKLPASESAGTTGDAHPHRTKITLSESTSHALINGHDCTPGDSSDACKNVCGGLFGPCKDVEQKLRLQEQHFVLARRLLLEKGVPFEPFTLLQPGGLERLEPVLNRMPEMRQIRREASPSGVIFADTLYLPENARFGAGPTVVIVNHIVYEGSCGSWTGTSYGNVWGTDGLYIFQRGEARVLGMTLERAMHEGGITNYGERNPPPYSVIKDLDIPKCYKGIHIGTGAPIHK